MKCRLLGAALSVLAFAAPARAAPVDMATLSCQDWLDADDDAQDQMVAWLRGYLSSKSASTLYDVATARGDRTMLKSYCQGHQTVGVVSAAGQWRR